MNKDDPGQPALAKSDAKFSVPSDIKHVSDTALWVAMFRAVESERPDALFHDPFARRLAGRRGVEIVKRMPYPKLMAWVMSVRTVALDRLIQGAIEEGCDTIVNMGAGLDTRPYRMQLPVALKWIELDFPGLIQHKNKMLKSETPVCSLERIAVDLSNRKLRMEILEKINSQSKAFAVLTEGVIMYLANREVDELCEDLALQPRLKFWIQDYRHGGYLLTLEKMKEALKKSPFRFVVQNWFDYFSARGWDVERNILAWDESKRLGRRFPFRCWYAIRTLFTRPKMLKQMRDASGYVTFRPRRPTSAKSETEWTGENPNKAELSSSEPSVSAPQEGLAAPTATPAVQSSEAPAQRGSLREGIDFVIENGLYVFSKTYLQSRGYCCDSGCRNCPY